MKKLFTIAFMALTVAFTSQVVAQDFSGMDKSPLDNATFPSSYKVAQKEVRITYSRPQLKGRTLSELAPAGTVWRTGANEAPEITFYKDVKFGGTAIKAGTYALLTIPGEKEWTVILHSALNQWGAYTYNKATDVARISASVSTGSKSIEAFSIAFDDVKDGANMVMAWDKVRVTIPITTDKMMKDKM